jgi:hypothetical protein
VKIELAYGGEGLEIDLPDCLNVDVVKPEYAEGLPDQVEAIEDSLLRPINSRPLRDLAGKGCSRTAMPCWPFGIWEWEEDSGT